MWRRATATCTPSDRQGEPRRNPRTSPSVQLPVTTPPRRPRSVLSFIYDLVLGAAAGFSVGFFAWLISDRVGDATTPAFWPFAVAGVLGMTLVVRWARGRKGGGRWIHVLWIPVILFLALMAMIAWALSRFS